MAKTVAPATCPICGKTTQERWHPFCSKRCADVDLGRWLTGRYAIPAEEEPVPEDLSGHGEGETEDR